MSKIDEELGESRAQNTSKEAQNKEGEETSNTKI